METDFVKENTRKTLFKMFLPVMLAMLLNLAYNLVDSLWIGNLLGDESLAALTSSTPVISITYSFAAGLTSGMSILLAQAVGSGDRAREAKVLATSFVITLVFCLLMTIVPEIFIDQILGFVGTPDATMRAAKGYLSIYLLGSVAVYFFCYITSMLRCYGEANFQLVAMVVTGVLNAVLDPIFIKRLSFQGAAFATILSQFISLVIMIVYLRKKKFFTIHIKKFQGGLIGRMLRTSLPAVLQQCIPSLSSFVITACVSNFGIAAIAGYGVSAKLEMLLHYPAMVLNMVLTPIVAYCVGIGRIDRANEYTKEGIKLGTVIVAVVGIFLFVFPRQIASAFGCSEAAMEVVVDCFHYLGVGYTINVTSQCILAQLNGYGATGIGLLIAIVNHIFGRIPLSYILSRSSMGITGIWIAMVIAFIAAFVMANALNIVQTKQIKKKLGIQ